ncbi:choice-of-anchor D domain-containing protein [Pseudooctadecabacter sp.]|uniref:choice-of-anchor D domain-containing protein n=1 Tax=Pseudooctadecabacter sp. TaxID=1966338 RepID=UPI0025E2F99B|nr:choice-of-anchor D domain-containing protein [Pseudooctadecabacter sp.]
MPVSKVDTPKPFDAFATILKTAAASFLVAGSIITSWTSPAEALEPFGSSDFVQQVEFLGVDCGSAGTTGFGVNFTSDASNISILDETGGAGATAFIAAVPFNNPGLGAGADESDLPPGVDVLDAATLASYCSGPQGLENITSFTSSGLDGGTGTALAEDTFYGFSFEATAKSDNQRYTFTMGFSDPNGSAGSTTFVNTRTAATTFIPEIDLSSSEGGALADAGTDNHGVEAQAATKTVTYTVSNTGTASLTLTAPPSFSNFINVNTAPMVSGFTPNTVIGPSSQTSFTISYVPQTGGFYSFDVSFGNDDVDENPYNWTIQGSAQPQPEISVSSDNSAGEIAISDTDDRGLSPVGVAQTATYTITNNGLTDLTLSGSATTSNTQNLTSAPVVGAYSTSTVAPFGGTSTFTVTTTSAAVGAFGYDLRILNSDTDEGDYSFRTIGEAAQPQEIDVSSSSAVGSIASGGSETLPTTVAQTTLLTTYTITNSGGTPLTLSGAPSVTSPVNLAEAANVSGYSATTVAPNGGTATFTVQVKPAVAGTFSYNVAILNDDSNENPYSISASGTATGTPEIQLRDGSGVAINTGGMIAEGSKAAGVEQTISLQIENQGTAVLTLSPLNMTQGATLANRVNLEASSASSLFANNSVAPSATTTFDVKYTPQVAGPFGFDISVASDDADESPYTISVSGTATGAPEISISSSNSGGAEIADGGSDTISVGIPAQAQLGITYTITNSGRAPLTLSGTAAVSNTVNLDASPIVGNFGTTTVAPLGGTTTFLVRSTPTIAGAFSYDLSVSSDDLDEGTYNISTSGTATGAPEIAVTATGIGALTSGSGTADLGLTTAGAARNQSFVISNSGTAPLSITDVTFSNQTNVTASLITSPPATIAPGGNETIVVSAQAPIGGAFSFDLKIANNDSDEAPFEVTVEGFARGEPEIEVVSSTNMATVFDGGTVTAVAPAAGVQQTITFTVKNTGTDTLTLLSPPAATNLTNLTGNVTFGAYGQSTVAPAGSTTFTAMFTPTIEGSFGFDFDIENDDSNENIYDIIVDGTATGEPEIQLSSSRSGAFANGVDDPVGTVDVGSSVRTTYTISNTGLGALTLTSPPDLRIATNVIARGITSITQTSVDPVTGSVTFEVRVTPAAPGPFSTQVRVRSDDADESTYLWNITGTAVGEPEIEIITSETGPVASGGTDTQPTIGAGNNKTALYTIVNSGNLPLILSGTKPVLSNLNNITGTPTVSAYSTTNVEARGGTATFTVMYQPSAAGAFGFDLAVASNDADESPYLISASGTATGEPEISVSSSVAGDVTSGDTADLGSVAALSSQTVTYTVTNDGRDTLTLVGDPVLSGLTNISGLAAVSGYSATSLAPNGGFATFTVTAAPALAGAFGYTATVTNDDSDESPFIITASGTATGTPTVEVSSTAGIIAEGGTTDLGTSVAGTQSSVTYTITNTGTDALVLSGSRPTISTVTNVAIGPSVGAYSSTTLAPSGGTATFTVTYTPRIAGPVEFGIKIDDNVSGADGFAFRATGTVTGEPEIEVTSLSSGSLTDNGSPDDHGPRLADSTRIATYIIRNTGTADLNIQAINISSPVNLREAPIASDPVSSSVPPFGQTTFTVTYTPQFAGPFGYALDIISTDMDEGNFDILTTGTATGEPRIIVTSDANGQIGNFGRDDVGTVPAGETIVRGYTISNTGLADLNLTGLPTITDVVNIDGTPVIEIDPFIGGPIPVFADQPNSIDFPIIGVAPMLPTLPPGGTEVSGDLTFRPANGGPFSFKVQIPTNDPLAAPFTFTVSGTATGEPGISISNADGVIAAGGSDDFGTVPAGDPQALTYTITNTGNDILFVVGTQLIDIVNAESFDVVAPAMPFGIQPGETENLTVNFTPLANGPFGAVLRVNSDAEDPGLYDISLSGTATGVPDIAVTTSANVPVNDNDTLNLAPVAAGVQETIVFTVANEGRDVLNLDGSAEASGETSSITGLSVSAYGTQTLDPLSRSTTFSVTYTPDRAGAYGFDLEIVSNDPDEDTIEFSVRGVATGEADIAVSSSTSGALSDGGTDAQGIVPSNIAQTITYTIENAGFDTLDLSSGFTVSNPVNVEGVPSSGGFVVSSLDVGEALSFGLDYTASAVGPFSFDLTIPSNDADEGTFTVTVSGSAEIAPEIGVTSSETGNVENFGVDTVQSSPPPGAPQTVSYTITNFGNAPLVLSVPTVTANLNDIFNVNVTDIQIGTTVVQPGQSTTVTVTYVPIALGAFGFDLRLLSDDRDEGDFNIQVRGVAVDEDAPVLTISGPTDPQLEEFTITIAASETILDLSLADFTVEGGSLGNLTGTGASYTATVTPILGETVSISIPAGGVTDVAGNPNPASNVYSVASGSPAIEFADNLEDIQRIVEQEARRNIRNEISANTAMMDRLLDGFIDRSQGGQTQSVPLDVDGNITISGRNMTTRGTFFGLNAEGDARRYTLGQFDIARDEDGSVTGQVSGRYAVEYDMDETLSMGYFIGIGFGSSELNGTFTGDVSSVNGTVGGFGLKQLNENLFMSGYAALGYTRSDISMTDGTLALDGTYDSTNIYAGVKLAGTVEMDGFELRPTVAIDYGASDIGVAAFDATAFGLTSLESADFGRVSVADLTIAPEIHISMAEGDAVIAPSLICRRETGSLGSDEACGYGLGINYTSEDDRFSVGFDYKNVEGDEDISLNALYELKF